MSIRTVLPLMLCCAFAVTAAAGCSTPSAPSSVGATGSAAGGTQAGALDSRFGSRTPGVVFVTSQNLYYDTFVVKDPLPMAGKFQKIDAGATEFGPGQPGYLGGRWWEDTNHNDMQDPSDHYFLCPLLPPGRPTP